MERFREGLDGELYERLNLIKIDSYPELVNLAISQEDAMKGAQQDRKRKFNKASGSDQGKKFKFVEKNVQGATQPSSSGRWVMKQSQSKPSGNFGYRSTQQTAPRPSAPHLPATMRIAVATTTDSWGTMITSAHALDSNISQVRGKALVTTRPGKYCTTA
jgi:hypothetical protein